MICIIKIHQLLQYTMCKLVSTLGYPIDEATGANLLRGKSCKLEAIPVREKRLYDTYSSLAARLSIIHRVSIRRRSRAYSNMPCG